jgi:hypothetical protein
MIVESDHVNETSWNDALRNAGDDGTIFQSTFWGEYARKVLGDHPIYLSSTDKKGNINGLLLAMQSRYGNFTVLTSSGMRGTIVHKLYETGLKRVFDRILPYVIWRNGPLVFEHSLPKDHSFDKTYCDLIEKILDVAEARNFYAIRFARPPYFADRAELMSSYGFEKRRMGTMLVDVGQSVKSMWESIDRKNRHGIEKADREITFAEVTKPAELHDFYRLHVQWTKRLKTKAMPFSHFESLWNFFFPLGKIVAFIAFLRNKPIATNILLKHNKMIHVYTYGDSDFARSNKICATDALYWHIMKWAHDRDFRYLDLSGTFLYKIEAGDQKAWNLYRFKSKWRGKEIEFNDYRKSIDRSAFGARAKSAKILSPFLEDWGSMPY